VTRLVGLVSGKGGVGKTTLAVNLGTVFAALGHDVLVVDADLGTPNIGYHIGTHTYQATLHDVLLGKAKLKDAIFYHHPTGLKFVPGHTALYKGRTVPTLALKKLRELLEGTSPVAFIDCPSGVRDDVATIISQLHDCIAVTTADLPSVMDTLKTLKLARDHGVIVRGVVLNRVRGHEHEMQRKQIESLLESKILGVILEHPVFIESLKVAVPVSALYPASQPALAVKALAHALSGHG